MFDSREMTPPRDDEDKGRQEILRMREEMRLDREETRRQREEQQFVWQIHNATLRCLGC